MSFRCAIRPLGRGAVGVCAVGALLAAIAGCGDGGQSSTVSGVDAVQADSCGAVEYGGDGEPDALIVSDLPMQGDSRERSRQQVDAIRTVLEDRHWSAGQTAVAFEACDDSIAKTGEWDAATCRSNAQAYADDADVVAVIGTYNSGCAAEIIPILNQAKDGPVAMVSPGNTFVCLTEPADTCKPSEPGTYYPTGKRNYVRVVPNDAAQAAGLADFSRKEGVSRPFVLYAAHDPTSTGQATAYRNAARAAGLEVSGFERWDPKAKDYTRLLQQVRSSGGDAVILAGLLEENGAQLIEDKVSVLGPNDDVKLLAFDGFAQQSTIDDAGKAAAGMFASVPGRAPENLAGPGKALVSDLEEQGDRPVELFAPYAGQAAEVVLDTVAQNGTGRGAVASGLFDTPIRDGITGSFDIERSGDPSVAPITVSVAKASFVPLHEVTPPLSLIAAARGD